MWPRKETNDFALPSELRRNLRSPSSGDRIFCPKGLHEMKSRSITSSIVAGAILFTQAATVCGQDLNVYRGNQVPPQVEKIYERGLHYLVASQAEDGSFPGAYGNEAATAGLAMLAIL